MDAYMYIKSHTAERVHEVCDLAGTKPTWLSLCARGHGKLSMDIALGLEAASRELAETHGDYMTVQELFNIERQVKERREHVRQKLLDKYAA